MTAMRSNSVRSSPAKPAVLFPNTTHTDHQKREGCALEVYCAEPSYECALQRSVHMHTRAVAGAMVNHCWRHTTTQRSLQLRQHYYYLHAAAALATHSGIANCRIGAAPALPAVRCDSAPLLLAVPLL
eukprot:2997-Heterococcus_DN1.PRE.3